MFKTTVLLAALMASFGAMAQEATPAPEIDNFKSGKSRAEVAAETTSAVQAGLVARNDADVQRLAGLGFHPTKARVQVSAEAVEANRLGLIARGEMGVPQATPMQLESIRLAGERALFGQSHLAMK
jgi:hypothetical protein